MQNDVSILALGLLALACSDDGANSPDSTGGTAGSSTGASGGMQGTGGSTGGTGGSSGSSGSSGTGGSTTGVRGAVSLHILAPQGCSLPDQFQDFPELSSGHPVTDTAKVKGVENGSMTESGEPVTVVCSWLGTAPPNRVSALIRIGAAGSDSSINIGAPVVQGETRSGSLLLSSRDLPGGYGSSASDPCMFTPIEVDTATRSVWARFTCGTFAAQDSTDVCAVGTSYFFFENCTPP
jgi:hypothetical protein